MRYRSINNCNQIWRIEFKIAAKCKEKENQEKKTVIEWLSCYWYDKLVQPVRPESTAARGDFINKSEQFDLVTKDHSLVRLPLYSFFFLFHPFWKNSCFFSFFICVSFCVSIIVLFRFAPFALPVLRRYTRLSLTRCDLMIHLDQFASLLIVRAGVPPCYALDSVLLDAWRTGY